MPLLDYLDNFIEQAQAQPEWIPAPAEPPGFWQSLRALKRTDSPPAYHQREWQDLETFRKTVSARMREYMAEPEPEHMLLIPAPPGSGKTWAGVDFAHWVYETTKHRVLYAGPRTKFFEDIILASVKQEKDLRQWYDWKARQSDDKNPLLHTCNYADKIGEWLRMGYEGMDFCSSVCGWAYINNDCKYHAQKERTEPLIYGHHQHVTLGHPLAKEFAVVVGDEFPLSSFIHEWLIPPKRVKFADVPLEYPLAPILFDLNRLCAEGIGKAISGPELLQRLGGAEVIRDAIDADIMALFETASVIAPPIKDDGNLDKIPANYLPTLLPVLLAEASAAAAGQEYPHRLYVDDRGLTILARRTVNEQLPKHTIWFDATGKPELYEAMFQRPVDVLDAQPKTLGKIFQVTDRGNGISSIVEAPDAEKKRAEKRGATQLRAMIDHICRNAQKPGVIVHKVIEETIGQPSLHFGGSRGTNEFEYCDILVVAGTPMIPLYQIERAAKCLYPERMRPFDLSFHPVDRAYQHIGPDGEGYVYPVSVFSEQILNALLWQYREAEIIQAAHRSRVLFRPDTTVWLLTNIPVDELAPDGLLTIRELFGAPDGVDVFKWRTVVDFIESREFVTAADLVDGVGINREAAVKYLGIFVASYGWEWADGIRRAGARGPAPKTITKPNNSRIVLKEYLF